MAPKGPTTARNSTGSSDVGTRLFDLFLQFNRRLQALLNYYQSPLSTNESHFLGELAEAKGIVARDLVERLYLDKSTLSRMVSALEKRGLVETKAGTDDAREKVLSLSAKGMKALKEDLELRTREVSGCVYKLDLDSLEKFTSYLRRIADTLKSPPITSFWNTEPLLCEIRRLTRSMGFIGSSVLSTGYPVDEVQVLWLLAASENACSVGDLGFSLPYELSDLSRLLNRLEDGGLIKRKTHRGDKRRVLVSLTDRGTTRINEIQAAGSNTFRGMVFEWQQHDVEKFLSLLERALYCALPRELLPQASSWKLSKCTTPEEKKSARAFLMEELVRQDLHHGAPPVLIDPSTHTVMLVENGMIGAVLEIDRQKEYRSLRIMNFVQRLEIPSRTVFLELLTFFDEHLSDETVAIPAYVEGQISSYLAEEKEEIQPLVVPFVELTKRLSR